MANVKLIFSGTTETETNEHELTCYVNHLKQIYVSINIEGLPTHFVCLDKSTAIKFAKTLRTEINKINN